MLSPISSTHVITRTLRSTPYVPFLVLLLALVPASTARPQQKQRYPPRLAYDAEFFDNYVTPLTPALRGWGPRPAAVAGVGVNWGPGVKTGSTRAPWAVGVGGGDTLPMASALRAQAGIGYGYGGSLGYGSNGFGSAGYSSPSIGSISHGGPSLGYYGDSSNLAVGASEVAGFGASSYGSGGHGGSGYGKGDGAYAGRVRIQVYRGPTQKAGPHKYWAPWGYFVTQPKNPSKGSGGYGGHSSYGSFGGYP